MSDIRFYPRTPTGYLRDVGSALLLGVGIGLMQWIGDTSRPIWPLAVVSALIGVSIYHSAIVLMVAFRRPLGHLEGPARVVALGLLFALSGALGFTLAILLVPIVSAGRWSMGSGSWHISLAFAGALGLVVGLVFYSYERLRTRLGESIARIERQEYAERELETARAIQRRLLPPTPIELDGYRIAARNLPAAIVAGDFYDVLTGDDGRLGLVVADVAGKGMGASLLMASVKAALPFVAAGRSAAATLGELNRRLAAELGPREFVALAYLRIDLGTGELELANAGLPDPYLLAPGAPPTALVVSGPRLPLGVFERIEYRSVRGRLGPGERLVLLTDGPPEALGADGSPLGYPALERLLGPEADLGGGDPDAWLGALFDRIGELTADDRADDWTALVVERRGSASKASPPAV